MELKNGNRRELILVGAILFGATLAIFWFLTNLYFDRWSTGTFAPAPFLPYPVIPNSVSWNSGHWTGLLYVYMIIGVPLAVAFIGEFIYVSWKWRDRPGREWKDSAEKIVPGMIPRSHEKPRMMLYLNIFVGVLLFSLAIYSLPLNSAMLSNPPHDANALTIEVIGFQWGWKFVYPDNSSTTGSVVVPINQEILFKVTSTDVMHDFAVPSLSIKTDAYPGHWNTAWTKIYKAGDYEAFCMELCGVGHADMIATIHAVAQLTQVTVSPSDSTIRTGGSTSFQATPTCSGGPCSAGIAYRWTLTNSRGNLSSPDSPSTLFTAGSHAGTDTLYVNATLYGVPVQSAAVAITIDPSAVSSGGSPPWYQPPSGS